jgi:hypothetical protein
MQVIKVGLCIYSICIEDSIYLSSKYYNISIEYDETYTVRQLKETIVKLKSPILTTGSPSITKDAYGNRIKDNFIGRQWYYAVAFTASNLRVTEDVFPFKYYEDDMYLKDLPGKVRIDNLFDNGCRKFTTCIEVPYQKDENEIKYFVK